MTFHPILRTIPARRGTAGFVLAAVVTLSGCVTVDSTLKADGSGSMTMTYQARQDATEASEKARFGSDAVTVESVSLSPDHKTGTVKVKWTDVTKLSTAKGFKDVTVTRTKADGTESITIKIANPDKLPPGKRAPLEKLALPPMKITLALPGKALEAGKYGATKESTVTWTIPQLDYADHDALELTAKYELPKS